MDPENGPQAHRGDRALLVFRLAVAVTLVAVAALLAWTVWQRGHGLKEPPPRTLLLYCFSAMQEVMDEGILPAFRRSWQSGTGERLEPVVTYAGSGAIVDRVVRRFPAEVLVLASEMDALSLTGIVRWRSWEGQPHGGIVTRSPMVLVVREHNPLAVHDFADIARAGIEVIHPDPTTSGGAKWGILAEFGSAYLPDQDEALAHARLLGVWRNVVVRAPSARAARRQFQAGRGDVLVTYEAEAVASPRGAAIGAVIYPQRPLLSEQVAVVVDRNVSAEQRDVVDAFLAFLWTPEAQRLFADFGFRPVLKEVAAAGSEVPGAYSIEAFGGPVVASREILDRVWRDRVVPAIAREDGSAP